MVGWPPREKGIDLGYDETYLWKHRGLAAIHIISVDGTEALYEVSSFQVRRRGSKITGVILSFPCETVTQAYDRAKQINVAWEVGELDELERWYRSWGPGGPGAGVSNCQMQNSSPDRLSVGVSIYGCDSEKRHVKFALWNLSKAHDGREEADEAAISLD